MLQLLQLSFLNSKKLPCLDVSGDDKPLKARINNTPEIR